MHTFSERYDRGHIGQLGEKNILVLGYNVVIGKTLGSLPLRVAKLLNSSLNHFDSMRRHIVFWILNID